MKWFKNLFGNNKEEIENDDFYVEEEWSTFSSKKIDNKQEETISVKRGFKFPMISDEEFSKRSMHGPVSAYEEFYQEEVRNSNFVEKEWKEPIHNPNVNVQPARERRRSRRHMEEAAPTTFNHVSERRLRTRERVEHTPPPLVNGSPIPVRKTRQPEVIANPIPKTPFKLTEVPSPVFGFKDRNVEAVNPNTIVEKYGKQDDDMDKLKSRVARRTELLKEQENKSLESTLDVVPTIPKKVVNDHFEEDLAVISEQGFNSIEPELTTTQTNHFNEMTVHKDVTKKGSLLETEAPKVTSVLDVMNEVEKKQEIKSVEAPVELEEKQEIKSEEAPVELEEKQEIKSEEAPVQLKEEQEIESIEALVELEEKQEIKSEEAPVKLEEEYGIESVEAPVELEEKQEIKSVEAPVELEEKQEIKSEEAPVKLEETKELDVAEFVYEEEVLEVVEELEQEEAPKPVFEYCEDCDDEEEVEVFGTQEQELAEDLEQEEAPKPVFEYFDDCDEEEVEVFGIQEQELAEDLELVKASKPVFEYCDDCDEEEVEVFGTQEQEVAEEELNEVNNQLKLGQEEVAATLVASTSLEEANQEEITEPVVRQKIRPFNVLMTKYDKMRWEQQQQRESLAVNETEPVEESGELVASTSVDEVNQEESQENMAEPVVHRKIRPFNVLMTKYDRARWEQQQERERLAAMTSTQSVEIPEPTKEIVLEERVMEEDIHFYDEFEHETSEIEEELGIEENNFIDDSFHLVEEEEKTEEVIEEVEEELPFYQFPSMDLLNEPIVYEENEQWLNEREEMLNATFASFNIGARVVHRTQGPSVTRFEVQLDPGVKVNKITNLSDDIQLGLAARDIRIEAPIPGKHTVGIEVPNDSGRPVRISEIINTPEFKNSSSPLTSVLGLDIEGKPIVTDLKKMPHGLIAGATGSGKSVCINSILVSLLYKADPTDVKLILIDPKMVELAPYNNIPHLVSPVITDVKAATAALKWAVEEMERRYQLFAHTGVREIGRYNDLVMESKKYNQKLPYIVVVIDELADLMMVAASDVEDAICRIAQKARACGIHLIIATQRPSVDVITGLIKANVPTRIAFSVSSQIDSRTIIDISGAEKLLGRGDMLFLENGSNKAVRLQGTYVTDEEIEAIVSHCKNERQVEYLFQQEDLLKKVEVTEEEDELFLEACEFVVEHQAASASMLQRRFKIGYNRAARLIDMMESYGYISENRGSKPRDVLITSSDLVK